MKRKYSTESESQQILLDELVTHITNFVPRSGWFAFQLVSKQFLRCARKRNLTAIKPNCDDLLRVCYRGWWKSLILLVGVYEMDPSVNDNRAIQLASQNGHDKVVALLLADPRVDPGADDNEAIYMASLNGYHKVVALLLADSRVDPTVKYNRAIHIACCNGHYEVVVLLLSDPRVDPSDCDNDTICAAAGNGDAKVVVLLLADPRVDPSAQDNWAITMASDNGDDEVVALLLADPRVDPSKVCCRRYMGTIPDRWRVGGEGSRGRHHAPSPPEDGLKERRGG